MKSESNIKILLMVMKIIAKDS